MKINNGKDKNFPITLQNEYNAFEILKEETGINKSSMIIVKLEHIKVPTLQQVQALGLAVKTPTSQSA